LIKLKIRRIYIDLQSSESALSDRKGSELQDGYSNDELATFMMKQQELQAVLGIRFKVVSERTNCVNETCLMIGNSLDSESVVSLEPSDEEIITFLKSS